MQCDVGIFGYLAHVNRPEEGVAENLVHVVNYFALPAVSEMLPGKTPPCQRRIIPAVTPNAT